MTLDAATADMQRRWKESGIPGLYEGHPLEMRERARNIRALLYPKPVLPTGRVQALTIPSAAGAVAARAVWPVQGAPTGTMVYFHGGGWVVGDIDSHDAHAVRIANQAGVVVVNVDYRLAPEHPFPAAADDAFAAMQWVHAHLGEFGGASLPLCVGGDSAGGNLAAVMAVQCRDAGIKLAAQLLLYPSTDLSAESDSTVRDLYLGKDAATPSAERARDPRVSPRWSANLGGMAPVILGVGPYDFLYKDNMAYVAALKQAGATVTLMEFPTLNHGFFSYTAISNACEAAANALCAELRSVLTR